MALESVSIKTLVANPRPNWAWKREALEALATLVTTIATANATKLAAAV